MAGNNRYISKVTVNNYFKKFKTICDANCGLIATINVMMKSGTTGKWAFSILVCVGVMT